jgi:hypothetical protein
MGKAGVMVRVVKSIVVYGEVSRVEATSIPTNAFNVRKKLTEVELCEGLVEIGAWSFAWCDHSITKINIPNSIRRINGFAFGESLRTPIRLHNGIESIGGSAFTACKVLHESHY